MAENYRNNISPEEMRDLGLMSFGGRIIIVDSDENLHYAIGKLKKSRILGFDTETKPSFKKGRKHKVALLQLSTDDTACLFRLNRIGLPAELLSILSDPTVIKTGVAIHDDLKMLSSLKPFEPAGFTDLQKFVKEYGIECSGLKKLTAIILGYRISKSQQVTDWEAKVLTEAQQVYAATDAWVCLKIFEKLTGYRGM